MKFNWNWDWIWKKLFQPIVEKVVNSILNKLQDELAEKLEESHHVPKAITAELFWKAVNAIEDKVNMDFEDETPGQ